MGTYATSTIRDEAGKIVGYTPADYTEGSLNPYNANLKIMDTDPNNRDTMVLRALNQKVSMASLGVPTTIPGANIIRTTENTQPALPKTMMVKNAAGNEIEKIFTPRSATTMFGSYERINPVTGRTDGVVGTPYAQEGTYKKVGTYMGTSRDDPTVSSQGTLWESDKGFWQFTDPSGQTIMSGSAGAPRPTLDTLNQSQIDAIGRWKNPKAINDYMDTLPLKEGYVSAKGTVPYDPDNPKYINGVRVSSSTTAPTTPSSSDTLYIYDKEGNRIEVKAQTTQDMDAADKTLSDRWAGTGIFYGKTSTPTSYNYNPVSRGNVTPNTKSSGNPVTGNVTGKGTFGSPVNHRPPKKPVKPKTTGFMGALKEAKKAPVNKPTKGNEPYSGLWSGITYGGKPKVNPKPVKKAVVTPKKKDSYGSTWADILFSKSKPKTRR